MHRVHYLLGLALQGFCAAAEVLTIFKIFKIFHEKVSSHASFQWTTEQRGQKFADDLSFSLFFKQVIIVGLIPRCSIKSFSDWFDCEKPLVFGFQGRDFLSPWHDIPLYTQDDPTNQVMICVGFMRRPSSNLELISQRRLEGF